MNESKVRYYVGYCCCATDYDREQELTPEESKRIIENFMTSFPRAMITERRYLRSALNLPERALIIESFMTSFPRTMITEMRNLGSAPNLTEREVSNDPYTSFCAWREGLSIYASIFQYVCVLLWVTFFCSGAESFLSYDFPKWYLYINCMITLFAVWFTVYAYNRTYSSYIQLVKAINKASNGSEIV